MNAKVVGRKAMVAMGSRWVVGSGARTATTATNANGPVAYADFRSDTVTLPSREMREVMAAAFVGDDVMREDETIKALEKHVATLCGKEDSMFCCSGTMSNQIGLRLHLNALESVICDKRAHVYAWESGGVAAHSQAQVIPLEAVTAEKIKENMVLSDGLHTAFTTTVSLENTILGSIYPLEEIKKIRALCDTKGMKLHLDGARLWNASVATKITLAEYSKYCDTVSLCLSKGLGAPVGSLLVGSRKDMQRARHFRKMFGGGWRQGGHLAAAGMYAIENNWKRMEADHKLAKLLANDLQNRVGLKLINPIPDTNIVWVDNSQSKVVDWQKAQALLLQKNIKVGNVYESAKIRLVTHLDINEEHVHNLISALMQSKI